MAKIELVDISKDYASQGWIRTIADEATSEKPSLLDRILRKRPRPPQAERVYDSDQRFALKRINLTVPHGSVMVLLGPSGCGKTTLLKIIAGLIRPDSGSVYYDDADMSKVPPGERQIGMVFQNYALYPRWTSRENILSYFAFRRRTPELQEQAREKFERTSELMGVDIAHLLERMPTNLSGGERQRIALARCITRDPVVFLLDEPFANLDQKLREKYRLNLKRLLRHFKITTVYVTHDQQEARIIADRMAIMSTGRIEQVGTYDEIYWNPQNLFVAEFLNLEAGTPAINVIKADAISSEFSGLLAGARPENVALADEKGPYCISGTVAYLVPMPMVDATIACVHAVGQEVFARLPQRVPLSPGQPVWLQLQRFLLFEEDTGRRVGTPYMV
jgi:ABC-type sugar transport system ATPase subunit